MHANLRSFCRAFIEVIWLAAAAAIPLFFNISSDQTFDPDKVFLLRFLVILGLAAGLMTTVGTNLRESWAQLRSTLRAPLVTPVLCLAAVYLLSSICSIAPAASWLGSYRRAQGTAALFCYLLLFLFVISGLRQTLQLKRLQFILILASFPVACYAILQQFSADPLPWNAVISRASGTMGNPIFLGGYLVMIVPLTVCRIAEGIAILRGGHDTRQGRALVSWCSLALLLQISALICTQSRGPVAGLVVAAYVCILVLAFLKRTPGNGRAMFPAAAAGIGLVAPIAILLAARMGQRISAGVSFAMLGAGIAAAALVYLLIWRASWGRAWFWLLWIAQTVSLTAVFVFHGSSAFNSLPIPSLGRLTQISGGSTNVRIDLWRSGIRYMQEGPPAVLADGSKDGYHWLRPALGYGPENIWLPANIHAVPSPHNVSGEAKDRMHNEVFDTLLTTGYSGSFLYLVIAGLALFYSLRFLGVDVGGCGKILFIVFAGLGCLAGIALPIVLGAPYLTGIGVLLGLLAGVIVFIASRGFGSENPSFEGNSRQLLVLGILGGLIAHLVETGTGIAVTSTRMQFYLFLGILSVLCSEQLKSEPEAATRKQVKSTDWTSDPALPYAVLTGLIVLVETWCFTFNTESGVGAIGVFLRSWFSVSRQQGIPIPGALAVLLLSAVAGIGLMLSERPGTHRPNSRTLLGFASLVTAGIWIVFGLLSAVFWTWSDTSSVTKISRHAETRISVLGIALLLLLLATALLLMIRETPRRDPVEIRAAGWAFSLVVIICAAAGVWLLSVRPAWADITSRVAGAHESAGKLREAEILFARSVELAPLEPAYRLSLGGVQGLAGMEQARSTLETAVALNPLDPLANRAAGLFHMEQGARSSEITGRTAELHIAITYFEKASALAPYSPDAYNERARCFSLLGEYGKANSIFEKSLQLGDRYSRTHMFLGEMFYRQKDLNNALRSFQKAVEFDQGNVEARKNLGFLLTILGKRDEAIDLDVRTLQLVPRDPVLLRRIALLYFGKGDYSSGLVYSRRAYDASSGQQNMTFDQYLEDLKSKAQ